MQATKKILIINSDNDLLFSVRVYLAGKNYQVLTARPDSGVTDFAQSSMPDLILLDAVDGGAACKDLKTDIRTYRIPILLMSVEVNHALLDNECSADGFIEKPFLLKTLLLKIQNLIS